MRIAFFEATEQDEEYLRNKFTSHELLFFRDPLTEKNVVDAASCEVISIFIYSSLTKTVLAQLPKVQLITTRSTGFDHIDIATCNERKILVANVPYYG